MRAWHILTAAMILAGPASAAQYERMANPPDPVAQRDAMIALYDEVCLRAFPDEDAAAGAAARHGATALSQAEVQTLLHDDPGIGWEVSGPAGRFQVTIEQSPPYHACAVRTMTADGFADLGPYQRLAARYEQGRPFERIGTMDRMVGNLHVVGGGEQLATGADASESLLIIITSASEAQRARGDTAVEMRFTHQFYGEAATAKPGD
jgi:hypothetical protein